jgi:hypothetical protein
LLFILRAFSFPSFIYRKCSITTTVSPHRPSNELFILLSNFVVILQKIFFTKNILSQILSVKNKQNRPKAGEFFSKELSKKMKGCLRF